MKKWITVILVFLVAAGCSQAKQVDYGKEDYQKIVLANNQLGFELLSKVEEDRFGNTLVSPTSLFMALSMVYNGADGKTKDEMAKLLQAEGMDVVELNQANASLMAMLAKESKGIQMKIANSIWLNKDFHFQSDFSQNTKDYFQARTEEMDVADSHSVTRINNWVKKQTNNTIEKIVEAPLNKNVVSILINAIYFKGDWKDEFDPKQTEERPFYLNDGTVKKWPLMMRSGKMVYLENDYFQAVSLPYGEGEMSMDIYLPKESSSLEAFERMLSNANWEQWQKDFYKKEGTIWMPKFTLEYEASLNDTLIKLGMMSAFDKNANFTRMIEEEDALWISEVKQKTFIDVNEEGTEASAVTSVEMETTSAPADGPFQMEINRPFFFAIKDKETNTVLFMGSIADPQINQ